MKSGNISMQTENMFPIIKKFLYSDNEIFLRELISNAVDATKKLQALVSVGQAKCELGDTTIEVKIDKDNKQLIISDKGIGMTADEVEKYINNVAFSGASEFLEKYKGVDAATLIGHFGLGFYSSFMVSDSVDIVTKSYLPDAVPVKWTCDGSTQFTIEETEKADRGTDIILHLSEDSLEFLEEDRILGMLKKYCKFLPVPIRFGNEKRWEKKEGEDKESEVEYPRIINNTNPLWKQNPSDLKQEDYDKFYHELYPYSYEQPLFHIHINIDYPFNLTGILSFPKVRQQVDIQKNKIQLYCNQVYITDQLEGIVPEFLMLLHGVIDSPDIPLNVSRSYLQSDSNVKKIAAHITKKVADKLEEMFKNDKEDFQKKWDDIKVFMQYGMLTDEKFYERAQKFSLLKNVDNEYFLIDDYKKKIATLQTNKDGHIVVLYATDKNEQFAQIAAAKAHGYDVLLMDGMLDMHFINLLEQKLEKVSFVRVDADVIEKLIEKDDAMPSKLSKEEEEGLKKFVESNTDQNKFAVVIENLSDEDMPMMITKPEFMRRMMDMQKMSGQHAFWGDDMQKSNLVVNTNHALITEMLNEKDEEKKKDLFNQLFDLALLSQQMLQGEALNTFVKRSLKMIKE
ncbi:MAG: molecular chaperone HtpG [Bacteroidales bacterium]|nr:molecular chaperone HtpG [Bacteroidales bacterium]MBR4453906.1 molecular chaperone HtpG [Bacteroidales bacterium]